MTPLREWFNHRIPDLRITRRLTDEGERVLNATFTFAGAEYAVGPVGGEDPEQAIEAEIAEVLWQTLGQAPNRARSLEQQIVQAALDGDEATRLSLTAEYIRTPSSSRNSNRSPRPRSRWTV